MVEEIIVTACPVLSVQLTSEDLDASVLTMTFVPLTVVVAASPVVAADAAVVDAACVVDATAPAISLPFLTRSDLIYPSTPETLTLYHLFPSFPVISSVMINASSFWTPHTTVPFVDADSRTRPLAHTTVPFAEV